MAGRPRKAEPEVALNAAMKAFWAKGYEATSMSDLTQATGLHKASLYQTFGDKHSLFVSALKLYFNKTTIALNESQVSANDSLEALRNSIDATIEQSAEGKGCLALNSQIEVAPFDPEVDRLLKQFYQRLAKQFTRLIDQARDERRISKSVDSKSAVNLITIFLNGIWANMASGMSKTRARRLMEQQLELVLSPRAQ